MIVVVVDVVVDGLDEIEIEHGGRCKWREKRKEKREKKHLTLLPRRLNTLLHLLCNFVRPLDCVPCVLELSSDIALLDAQRTDQHLIRHAIMLDPLSVLLTQGSPNRG